MNKNIPEEIPEIIEETEKKSINIDLSPQELSKKIDNTELSPYKGVESIKELRKESESYGFHSVCINPYYTQFCRKQLKDSDVSVDTVIGFPLGQITLEDKVFQTQNALEDGTDEIDLVMNIAAFRDGKYDFVKEELKEVVEAAENIEVKVIIEAPYLTLREIVKACKIVEESRASFVKNSTGFTPYGANILHIYIMEKSVRENTSIKAAGGISDYRNALRLIAAGADRLGTSSGVKIIESYESLEDREWDYEKIPCNLCPSKNTRTDKIPKSTRNYYESVCSECSYEK